MELQWSSCNRKGSYIRNEYNNLQHIDIALKICWDIKDFEITHKVIHSFRSENDTYAGLTFAISKNYEVSDQHELEKGRIYEVRCKSKLISDLKYNIVGFHEYSSDYSTAQRNRLIIRVKEALKVDEVNILIGILILLRNQLTGIIKSRTVQLPPKTLW